jgi:predicted fused transcriptional regulator/phosphomethylpyrimidine kinase
MTRCYKRFPNVGCNISLIVWLRDNLNVVSGVDGRAWCGDGLRFTLFDTFRGGKTCLQPTVKLG